MSNRRRILTHAYPAPISLRDLNANPALRGSRAPSETHTSPRSTTTQLPRPCSPYPSERLLAPPFYCSACQDRSRTQATCRLIDYGVAYESYKACGDQTTELRAALHANALLPNITMQYWGQAQSVDLQIPILCVDRNARIADEEFRWQFRVEFRAADVLALLAVTLAVRVYCTNVSG